MNTTVQINQLEALPSVCVCVYLVPTASVDTGRAICLLHMYILYYTCTRLRDRDLDVQYLVAHRSKRKVCEGTVCLFEALRRSRLKLRRSEG